MRSAARLGLVAAAAWLAACAGGGGPLERLDEQSGITLTRSGATLVFARTEARYSRSARDYLYVAPVETNRRGLKEYYLWVGVATTLDRGYLAPAAPQPQRLLLTLTSGEPLELALHPWRELVPLGTEAPVFATSVPLTAELAARVTLQQLALLGAEPLAAVGVDSGGGTAASFVRWREQRSFAELVGSVVGAPSGSVQ